MDFREWQVNDKVIQLTGYHMQELGYASDALKGCENVLEVGIGYGGLAKRLIEQGKRVTGIDIDPEKLTYVRTKIGPNPRLVLKECDALNIPYDSEFDGAACFSSFHDIGNYQRLLHGISRALRHKGILSITDRKVDCFEAFQMKFGAEIVNLVYSGALTEVEMLISFQAYVKRRDDFHRRSKVAKELKVGHIEIGNLLETYGFVFRRYEEFYDNTCFSLEAEKNPFLEKA